MDSKERAAKYRQVADILDELAQCPRLAHAWRSQADVLDPPDPFAGLDDDEWVEFTEFFGKQMVKRAQFARREHEAKLIRVIPDGDARQVLVIPVDQAQRAVDDYGCDHYIRGALERHEKRWSK